MKKYIKPSMEIVCIETPQMIMVSQFNNHQSSAVQLGRDRFFDEIIDNEPSRECGGIFSAPDNGYNRSLW